MKEIPNQQVVTDKNNEKAVDKKEYRKSKDFIRPSLDEDFYRKQSKDLFRELTFMRQKGENHVDRPGCVDWLKKDAEESRKSIMTSRESFTPPEQKVLDDQVKGLLKKVNEHGGKTLEGRN